MATIKFIITGRYEAEEEFYGTNDPDKMAEMDKDSVDNKEVSIVDVLSWAHDRDISIEFEGE